MKHGTIHLVGIGLHQYVLIYLSHLCFKVFFIALGMNIWIKELQIGATLSKTSIHWGLGPITVITRERIRNRNICNLRQQTERSSLNSRIQNQLFNFM